MGNTIARPSGPTIGIYAGYDDGTGGFLGFPQTGELAVATNGSAAASFILEDDTGYLYIVDSLGYYPMPTVPFEVTNYTYTQILDASLARTATAYKRIVCTMASTVVINGQVVGVLTCEAPTAAASPLRLFGLCNNVVVAFATCDDYVANCPGSNLSTCQHFDGFWYMVMGSDVAIDSSSSSTRPTTPAASSAVEVASRSALASPEGSCSVTVMLHIEQSTTYVPYGYVAPASPGGVSTLANGGLGGGDAGGDYGCTPITSTVSIHSTTSPTLPPIVLPVAT